MIKKETKYDMGKSMNKYGWAFIVRLHLYPCAYIARYDVMAYSHRVLAPLHPLHCIWTPHPRWWMCYVGRLRNRPIKVINGSTRTPGRPRAVCLRPNLSLKIEFFSFYLPRHGVSKDYSCQFLLLSILLSIAYLLKCTLHDHLIQIHLCSRGPIFPGLSIQGDVM